MGSKLTLAHTAYCAVLSVGTNSTRMIVCDMRPRVPHVELARTVGTRIGEGLGEHGDLGEEPMSRTAGVLREYAKGARDRGAALVVIATSAVRRAHNAQAFAARVKEATGEPLRILTGEEEAQASFRGAVGSLPPFEGRTGVVDIGGGSTEYAVGTDGSADAVHSYEIGAVRLTEQLPVLAGEAGAVDAQSLADAARIATETLAPMREAPSVERLLLVGGSATTTAAIADLPSARAPELTREVLAKTLERLCLLDVEQRKGVAGMRPQRADILPAGIILLATVMELTGRGSAIVAPGDLLLGVLLGERERGKAIAEPKEGE